MERDAIAKSKVQLGHLEGDLTFNKGEQSRNIGGCVDILSQKVFHLNNSKRSNEVISNMRRKLKPVKNL